ncbi:MAG: hypothetical protein KGL39_13135 [Patescibacteria group bacterium]|nr:hypothetical protein [Patescibacteria group bacterium]
MECIRRKWGFRVNGNRKDADRGGAPGVTGRDRGARLRGKFNPTADRSLQRARASSVVNPPPVAALARTETKAPVCSTPAVAPTRIESKAPQMRAGNGTSSLVVFSSPPGGSIASISGGAYGKSITIPASANQVLVSDGNGGAVWETGTAVGYASAIDLSTPQRIDNNAVVTFSNPISSSSGISAPTAGGSAFTIAAGSGGTFVFDFGVIGGNNLFGGAIQLIFALNNNGSPVPGGAFSSISIRAGLTQPVTDAVVIGNNIVSLAAGSVTLQNISGFTVNTGSDGTFNGIWLTLQKLS